MKSQPKVKSCSKWRISMCRSQKQMASDGEFVSEHPVGEFVSEHLDYISRLSVCFAYQAVKGGVDTQLVTITEMRGPRYFQVRCAGTIWSEHSDQRFDWNSADLHRNGCLGRLPGNQSTGAGAACWILFTAARGTLLFWMGSWAGLTSGWLVSGRPVWPVAGWSGQWLAVLASGWLVWSVAGWSGQWLAGLASSWGRLLCVANLDR